ncbi:MAG: hypothetical protein WD598_01480 [Acidimicrobiia bacterium]
MNSRRSLGEVGSPQAQHLSPSNCGITPDRHARVELERVPHTHVVHSLDEVPRLLEVVSTRVHAA